MRVGNLETFDSVYDIILENDASARVKKIGIFPGAFKPPHRGHYNTAASACSQCNEVYIIMSPKERLICQKSKDTGLPEWEKFKSLLPGGKTHEKLNNAQVELAEVDRQTSASKFRARILDTALDSCDLKTFTSNIVEFLPDVDENSKNRIAATLMGDCVKDGVITSREAEEIWSVYIEQLRRDYADVTIHFTIADISPIIDTHDLVVDELDREPCRVLLFTGQ